MSVSKKFQIFISSTRDDLLDERQAVVQAILNAGHIPAGMEIFSSTEDKMETIKKWIEESDIFLLILGGRYGSIYEKEKISFTEFEYRYAMELKKPYFPIVLSDGMLHDKAKKNGDEKIYERKNRRKYENFKKEIMEDRNVHPIDSIDAIGDRVLSNLNEYMFGEKGKNLVGWVKGDQAIGNYSVLENGVLNNVCKEIFEEYVKRQYKEDIDEMIVNIHDLASTTVMGIENMVKRNHILESMERHVVLSRILDKDDLIKVTQIKKINYRYMEEGRREFGITFQATKQQAESFRVERLTINQVDCTEQLKLKIVCEEDRGQMMYVVKSEESIPIDKTSCGIYYKCSYETDPLAFFQTTQLSCPCKNFNAAIILEGELEKQYTVLSETFSMASKRYGDSYLAAETTNDKICTIELPEWSMPGSGYVATLKRKSIKNGE